METPCQLQIVRLFTTCWWWLGVSEKLQRNTTKLGVSEKTQQQLKSFSLKITSKKKKKKQKKKKKVGMKKKKEKSALRGEVLGGQYGPPTVHRCCKSLNPHLSSSQGAVDPHTHTPEWHFLILWHFTEWQAGLNEPDTMIWFMKSGGSLGRRQCSFRYQTAYGF